MNSHTVTRAIQAAVACALGLVLAGCGGTQAKFDRFVPDTEAAREALGAAMTAWQSGDPPGRIDTHSPPTQVVDTLRQAGQTLASYEILSEVSGETPKRFSVRLKLENPSQEQEAHYVVLGRDPIWVFREEDYARAERM